LLNFLLSFGQQVKTVLYWSMKQHWKMKCLKMRLRGNTGDCYTISFISLNFRRGKQVYKSINVHVIDEIVW